MARHVPAAAAWAARAAGAGGEAAAPAALEKARRLVGLPARGGPGGVGDRENQEEEGELGRLLGWVGKVAEAEVPEGTPPCWTVLEEWDVPADPAWARPDAPRPGERPLAAEAVVALAPRAGAGGCIAVPAPTGREEEAE